MENKKSKLGLGILIGVLIGLVLGLGSFIIYDKVINKDKNNNIVEDNKNDAEDKKESNNQKKVKLEDKYALEVFGNNINLYLLNNGSLYYKSVESSYIMTFDDIDDTCSHSEDFNNKDLTKFAGLNDIVRIKGANTISTGEAFNVLLITKDGSVYSYVAGNDSAFKVELFEKYKVDDIIKYSPVNGCVNDGTDPNFKTCGATFEILTQEGKTVSGILNTDGTITEK